MSESDPSRKRAEQQVIILLAGNAAARRAHRGSEPGWRRHLTREQHTAYHEAGHIVVATILGDVVFHADIATKPELGRRGVCLHGPQDSGPKLMPMLSRRGPSDIKAVALCLYLMVPGHAWRDMLTTYRQLQRRTEELVEDHWRSIKLLAIELNQRKELNQEQIERILGRFICGDGAVTGFTR